MLSTRAMNVVINALDLYGLEHPRSSPALRKLAQKELPRIAADRERPLSVGQLLMRTKGCGAVSAREILTWLGRKAAFEPHACVCRQCGRRM